MLIVAILLLNLLIALMVGSFISSDALYLARLNDFFWHLLACLSLHLHRVIPMVM
jgi:hypothetical protein